MQLAVGDLGGQQAQPGEFVVEDVLDRNRAHRVGLEIDHIHEMLRIMLDLPGALGWTQTGVAQADHARVIVGHPLDRARAQAGHDTHEALLALEPRRPQEGVAAEAHSRQRWEEIALVLAALNLL